MSFATQCPACKLVDPPHKLRGSQNLIECSNCHSTFNRFVYVYLEDPEGYDEGELGSPPLADEDELDDWRADAYDDDQAYNATLGYAD